MTYNCLIQSNLALEYQECEDIDVKAANICTCIVGAYQNTTFAVTQLSFGAYMACRLQHNQPAEAYFIA